jgi:hypothetical protein
MQSEIWEERVSTFLSCSIISFSVLCPQDTFPKARAQHKASVKVFDARILFSDVFGDNVSMFEIYY